MPDDLAINGLRQYEQDELQRGGGVLTVTIVRYHLGAHGPFTARKLKTEPFTLIEDQIRNQRRELESLARL